MYISHQVFRPHRSVFRSLSARYWGRKELCSGAISRKNFDYVYASLTNLRLDRSSSRIDSRQANEKEEQEYSIDENNIVTTQFDMTEDFNSDDSWDSDDDEDSEIDSDLYDTEDEEDDFQLQFKKMSKFVKTTYVEANGMQPESIGEYGTYSETNHKNFLSNFRPRSGEIMENNFNKGVEMDSGDSDYEDVDTEEENDLDDSMTMTALKGKDNENKNVKYNSKEEALMMEGDESSEFDDSLAESVSPHNHNLDDECLTGQCLETAPKKVDEDLTDWSYHQMDDWLIKLLIEYNRKTGEYLAPRAPTRGDGNCWFRAVADQIILHSIPNLPTNHLDLRKAVVASIPSLPQFKEWSSLLEATGDNMTSFLINQAKPSTWVDDSGLMCVATALLVGHPIMVVGTANIGNTLFTVLESVQGSEGLVAFTVAYSQGSHYQSLQRVEKGSRVSKEMDRKIAQWQIHKIQKDNKVEVDNLYNRGDPSTSKGFTVAKRRSCRTYEQMPKVKQRPFVENFR